MLNKLISKIIYSTTKNQKPKEQKVRVKLFETIKMKMHSSNYL